MITKHKGYYQIWYKGFYSSNDRRIKFLEIIILEV